MPEKYSFSAVLRGNVKQLPQFLVLLAMLTAACPAWGQVLQKKDLTEADYRLWEITAVDKLSPDGRWASYHVGYESGNDTLFVRNTANAKTYALPSGSNSMFTKGRFFYCQSGNDLRYINLETGKQQAINGVRGYQYSAKQNLILYLVNGSAKTKELRIQTPAGKVLRTIGNAAQYSFSPDGGHLLCSVLKDGKYALLLIDLKKITDEKWIIPSSPNQLTQFVWSKDSRAAAFFSAGEKNTIKSLLFYRLDLGKLFEFDPAVQTGFPGNSSIVSYPDKVLISDDLQRVFFHIGKKPANSFPAATSGPEIWNTNDKLIYPQARNQMGFANVTMWRPVTGGFLVLTSEEFPKIMLSGNQQHALLSDPSAYEPQYGFESPRDYYLLDLNTMKKTKILSKASYYHNNVIPSPDGRYIAYFKDNNWWTYNILQDIHTDITSNLGTAFAGRVYTLDPSSAFGHPGWSADNKEVLLYDQYDIWAVKPDGSASRRLTRGREARISYRIADDLSNSRPDLIFDGIRAGNYDLDRETVLKARGSDGKTGYFLWKDNRIEKVAYGDYYIDQLHYTADKKGIIYCRQKFDLSPQLIFKAEKGRESVFLQSNPQHRNYHWGKAELVRFENSKHQKLKGALYYPANYDPGKKYPMIVHIYESQSGDLHSYQRPSMQNGDGFNPAVLTTQGYFVFLPDILLENENVGPSALDCTTAGVEKVISMGMVDPGRIGLTGHSFGGYETAFIINHTKLFKTAIASGAITNLTSYFLTVNWSTGKPDMWRLNEQWQMNEKTPFEHPDIFSRNSPLAAIMNLQTPLLLWSGKEDMQVDWHQSVEYHLALRRLGKKNIMLLYPKEAHILSDPANQEDITRRVLQWFGHYLKDEKPADWIEKEL